MRTLDRYLIRETIPPFFLALGVLTFVLAINPMLEYAQGLLSKGVPVGTVAFLLATLLPQALGLTIPMAFLTGLLMALGRLSGDRESVALAACGVSPVRLLRPVLALGLIVGGLDMYVLMKAKPDANQAFRATTFRLLSEQGEADIKPRIFFERFPGMVLYVGDTGAEGGWTDVLLADTSQPGRPAVTLAESGRLVVDHEQRLVRLVLRHATQYAPGKSDSRVYVTSQQDPLSIRITPEAVFGSGDISRGLAEMGFSDLRREIAAKEAKGISAHNEIMHLQQMFSFPVACLVFALLGLALGLNTRKEGRLAGLTLGLAVILVYYALFGLAEAWTKGEAWHNAPHFPAAWARWVPNVALGLLGLLAVWWRTRPPGTGLALPRLARRTRTGRASVRRSTAAPTLVLRLPAGNLPGPRLLDRYVSGRYLRMAGLAFVSLLALYYIGTFLDLADKLFKGQATPGLLAQYLWYSTPQFTAFVIPIATLVAVLGTIGALTRTGELTVMRACGVSLYRAALPLVLIAVLWSGLLFVLGERVLGESNRQAHTLEDIIRGRAPRTVNVANRNWLVGADGRVYYYAVLESSGVLNSTNATLHGLSVFDVGARPYRLLAHTYATRARYEGGQWIAENGWTQSFRGNDMTRRDFSQTTVALAPIEDFQRAQVDASQMNFWELRDYVRRLGDSGFNVAEQRVNLHRKVAFPLVTVVMTLLAIPFGATTGRKGALYGIGLAVVLAGSYFLLMTFFVAVGSASVLPAPLAAWGANLLFAAGALYMMLSVRT